MHARRFRWYEQASFMLVCPATATTYATYAAVWKLPIHIRFSLVVTFVDTVIRMHEVLRCRVHNETAFVERCAHYSG